MPRQCGGLPSFGYWETQFSIKIVQVEKLTKSFLQFLNNGFRHHRPQFQYEVLGQCIISGAIVGRGSNHPQATRLMDSGLKRYG